MGAFHRARTCPKLSQFGVLMPLPTSVLVHPSTTPSQKVLSGGCAVSVVRSETFADSNRPPAVELKQHQRVCRELDEWKQRALNAQRQLSQFTTFAGCEKLKESERIRSWAVVTVAAASKPDADGWRFINLFDVVTVAGIAVTPKDESDDALRQARSNAKSTASRAITFVEGCGVLERGDQIYFHDDEDDSNKITGSRARVRFTVPVDQALNAIAFQTEPRPAPKSRGIHVAPLKCPNCGSTDHMYLKCSHCEFQCTGDEWTELQVQRLEAKSSDTQQTLAEPGLQNLQPKNVEDTEGVEDSLGLQIMQPGLKALEELQAAHQWVFWKWKERNGKRTKPPFNPATGKEAISNDPACRWLERESSLVD